MRYLSFISVPLRRGAGCCLVLLAGLLAAAPAFAQTTPTGGVGIGTTAPDVSAALDIVSSTKGALLPRVADATTIATPATGLLVFQTGGTPGFYYNAGTPAAPGWQQLATAAGAPVTAGNGLTKTGADIALGGILTRATALTQNGNSFSLLGGNVGIGTSTPASLLTVQGLSTVGAIALDQQQVVVGGRTGNADVWQSFTAGTNGGLVQVDMLIETDFQLNGTAGTLSVYAGEGTGGPLLATQGVVFRHRPSPGYQSFGLLAPVAIVAGQQYTFRFEGYNGTTHLNFSNVYPGGQTNLGGAVDYCFRTYVAPTVIASVLTVQSSGRVGIGTASPSQQLEVAGQVFSSTGGFRFPDGSVQTSAAAIVAGSAILNQSTLQAGAEFNIGGNGYVAGNVGIGTTAPSQKLDVAGNVRVGTANTVGEVLTSTTGNSNMLAAAYGQTGNGSGGVFGGSGNYSVTMVSTGVYDIVFPASSGLSGVNFADITVNVSLYGNAPGFVTYRGGPGFITVRTFNTAGTPSQTYYFSFSVFVP